MGTGTPETPVRKLENLARLLEQAARDPSMRLAGEFVREARSSLEGGDPNTARRAMASARLALHWGGHDPGAYTSALGTSEDALAPLPLDPPAPPRPPRPR